MGSAVNTPIQTENEASQGTAATRPNPVALETLVNVTGARPSSEGTRDLFTEETRTILVFVDGAVIQLTSPVSEGQLLFLTNKKSNEEVVCQVMNKKKLGATACYVELQFTEEKPNYWGVTFPRGKKGGTEFTAAEHVAAKQTTERDTEAPLPPRRDEKAVEDLKTQVETLRSQLAELEKKNAAEAAANVALDKGTGTGAGEGLLMPPAAAPETKKAPGWTVPMALPTQSSDVPRAGAAKEVEPESLPKPELDFSRVPSTASAEEIASRASMKGASPWREKVRMAGLIVVLVAVGFGAYEKLAPYVLSVARKTVSSGGAAKTAAPKPLVAKTAQSGSAPAATGSNAAPSKQDAPESRAVAASENTAVENVPAAGSSETNGSESTKKKVEAVAETKPAGTRERAAAKKASTKDSAKEGAPTEVGPADGPMIPAKLLHAATPVYPPDAMRSYITGDVKAELVVEASGKVGEVRVISGPNALREAALEALKKYEYVPATQGGKSVASKTTAVVKFWFNP